jgi:hypothetical protein
VTAQVQWDNSVNPQLGEFNWRWGPLSGDGGVIGPFPKDGWELDFTANEYPYPGSTQPGQDFEWGLRFATWFSDTSDLEMRDLSMTPSTFSWKVCQAHIQTLQSVPRPSHLPWHRRVRPSPDV